MIDVIITGASGFIGSMVVNKLKTAGKNLIALSSKDGSVSDAETWHRLPSANSVIHLAGRSYIPNSWHDSVNFVNTNVIGTEQALTYCRRTGASLVIASAYLYGIPQRLPIHEQDTPHPNNPYALSKWLAEKLCEFSSQYYNVPVTALRIFNVFGPGQKKEFLIPSIIDQVIHGNEIKLQDLTPRRDYVYIDDVADALIKSMNVSDGYNCINIGSGKSYSVSEIVKIIQSVAGTKWPVISTQVKRAQEIPDVTADIGMAKRILDWHPNHTFEDGIKKMILGAAS